MEGGGPSLDFAISLDLDKDFVKKLDAVMTVVGSNQSFEDNA